MVLNLMETDERFPPRLRAFLEEYQRSVAAEELPATAPIAEAAVEEVVAVDIGPGPAPTRAPGWFRFCSSNSRLRPSDAAKRRQSRARRSRAAPAECR